MRLTDEELMDEAARESFPASDPPVWTAGHQPTELRYRVWFITGTSSGLGQALAETVAAHGGQVIATARKLESLQPLLEQYPESVRALTLDVTDREGIPGVVEQARTAFGRVDVVVNNAGYGTVGALEEFTEEQIRRQFETNFFGPLQIIREFLPLLREQGGGHIVNISSMGGFVSFGGAGLYCASKFALEAVSEALREELAPFGIRVTIVEPGAFRTGFNGGALQIAQNRLALYDELTGGFARTLEENDGKQPGDPRKGAAAIIKAVEASEPPLRLPLGADAMEAIQAKLRAMQTELDTWGSLSRSAVFSDSSE